MNTTILSNYLIYTLIPALHEKRIHIGDDTYRVHVTDCSRAGEFVHINIMAPAEEDDDWSIVATPGWDGATSTIPIDVHHDAGEVVLADSATDVAWTGKLDYDVQIYLHTVRNHIVKVILPALWGKPKKPITVEALRAIEGTLRTSSTDLWALTVDDPETATVESEKDGMTPERETIRDLRVRLDQITTDLEDFINVNMSSEPEGNPGEGFSWCPNRRRWVKSEPDMDHTIEPDMDHTIVCLDDGETWAGEGYHLDLTNDEYKRIMNGEKVRNVVPAERMEDASIW